MAEPDVGRGSSPPDTESILETERLLLRPLRDDDVEDLAEIFCDAETVAFYPRPFTREEVQEWISGNRARFEEHGRGLLAVVMKETGECVGDCGITDQEVDGVVEPELGWHVKRKHWRRGIATEAGLACRDFGFSTLGIPTLISLILPENIASRRVAEKIGMTVEREGMHAEMNHLVYAIHDRSR